MVCRNAVHLCRGFATQLVVNKIRDTRVDVPKSFVINMSY